LFKNKTIKAFLFPLLAILFFISGNFIQNDKTNNYASVTSQLEKKLHRKEERVVKELETLSHLSEHNSYADLFSNYLNYYSKLFEKHGLVFLIYENDTLKFWTDHSVVFENDFKKTPADRLILLKNGWYETFVNKSKPNNKKIFVALLLIKSNYPTQNEYLENLFQKNFDIDNNVKISPTHSTDVAAIHNYKGEYLFSVAIDENYPLDLFSFATKILFYILGIIFTIFSFQKLYDKLKTKTGYYLSSFVFAVGILLLRYLSISLKFPEIFYESALFNPQLYGDASSLWLSSLGDFFINSLIILYITYHIFQRQKHTPKLNIHSSLLKQTIVVGFILLLFLISKIINELITGLIINSNIYFTVNNIFSLNSYSCVAFVCVSCLLLSFYFIANKINTFISDLQLKNSQSLVTLALSVLIITVISHLIGELDEILFLWSSLVLTILYVLKNMLSTRHAFAGRAVLLLILSFYSAHIFLKFSEYKENSLRVILAEKFSAEQDTFAEQLFSELEPKIQTDTSISVALNQKTSKYFGEKLVKKYFNGYWKKYDIKITIADSVNLSENNFSHLRPTQSSNLFYTDDPSGKIQFVANIPIAQLQNQKAQNRSLYITFSPRFLSEKIGFPELLVDKGISIYQDLKKYSFAKYRNSQLISFYGDYSYPSVYNLPISKSNYSFYDDNEGYNHLIYKNSENAFVVLTKKIISPLDELTAFSFLFTLYSLLLLPLLIYQLTTAFNLSDISFKNKIQYFLILIIFLSTLVFSGTSVFYIKKQYEEKNRKNILEKTAFASKEMQKELEEKRDVLSDPTDYVIQNASDLYSTDVNLYDPEGNLISSSIPKLFDDGLLSHKMCPEAYAQLSVNKENEFAHDEKIGSLDYLSAYVPLKSQDGELVGYLNMPYFSKQSDLEQEISSFLAAIINIYVLLFLLSAMTAVLISGYITRPLSMIQEKMRMIKFGKTNEQINWKNNDEIGSLITEYNRMITELAKSAELLAKSERESAWREMAKQVAHEIKNPLTPMKLSVQHFEKTWKNKEVDNDKKIKRFTETLIEQIETLTSIANEFSNFARMPKSNYEKVNIQNIISGAIDLHQNLPNINIEYFTEIKTDIYVNCDKEQLLRVFTNLIKNAVQSIPQTRDGKITITLAKENSFYLISITDNGAGINDELKEKIFVPNFTTKTGGTGLGLAMSKNIIESFNGKIWFETKVNEGTTFSISLPEYKS